MWLLLVLFVGAVTGQRFGNQRGGIQTLKSAPLPPRDYVSPSYLRQQNEPPKPFSYQYEGPDPYGGYSSHESTGDDKGRITGQYTVQNPDGSSRLVRYVADPETGFHAEVETDEEGTKTSEPANVSIISTAPEETYSPPSKASDSNRGRKPTLARNIYKPAQNRRPSYNAPRAPAPFANSAYRPAQAAYRSPQTAYRAPGRQSTVGLGQGPRRNTGIYQQGRNYNDFPRTYNRNQQARTGTYGTNPQRSNLNQQRTFNNPSLNYKYDINASRRGTQSRYGAARPNYANQDYNSNALRSNANANNYSNQNRFTG